MGRAAATGMSAGRPRQNSVVTCADTRTVLRAAQHLAQPLAQPPAHQIGATLAATSCSWPTGTAGHTARTAPWARARWHSSDRAVGIEGTVSQWGCHHSRTDRSSRLIALFESGHPVLMGWPNMLCGSPHPSGDPGRCVGLGRGDLGRDTSSQCGRTCDRTVVSCTSILRPS